MGQKHITGFAGTVTGKTTVIFSFCEEFGYDALIGIEDLTNNVVPTVIFRRRDSRTDLIGNYFTKVSGSRSIRMHFSSGESRTINVFYPSGEFPTSYKAYDYELKVNGNWDNNSFSLKSFNALESPETYSFSNFPVLDPTKTFNFNEVWLNDGINISSNLSPISAPQFVMILGAKGVFNSPTEILQEVLSGDIPSVVSWIWSESLFDIPNSSPKFEVCLDPYSSTYYLTSGLDSTGTAIPDIYLGGSAPAIFESGVCNAGSKELSFAVAQTAPTTGATATISVSITGIKLSPAPLAWINYDPLLLANQTVYPAISGEDFEFKIVKTNGTVVTTGVITGNSTTFTALPASKLPYEVIVIDQDSSEVGKIKLLISEETYGSFTEKSKSSSVDVRFPTSIKDKEDATSQQTLRNCRCTILTALNTANTGAETEQDLCNICYTCSGTQLLLGGVATPHSLLYFNTTLAYNATSATTSDGSVTAGWSFDPNLSQDVLLALTGSTYDIKLYKANTQTGPFVTQVGGTVSAHTLQSYTFSSLVPGFWYQIQVYIHGQTCLSTYTFFIGPLSGPRAEIDCTAVVDYSIDPCTGAFNVAILDTLTPIEGQIVYINGVGVEEPYPNVNEGDVISVKLQLEGCADVILDSYYVTEADLNCPHQENNLPLGCMDPAAVNFDPSAVIDNGMCIYGIVGCTDPQSTNYNPNATISDDSCIDLCSEDVIVSGVITANIPTINFVTRQSNYSLTFYNPLTGFLETVYDTPTGPYLEDGVYVVTFMSSIGCVDTLILPVNTDVNYGCTDPFAENFSAFANLPMSLWNNTSTGNVGEECTYSVVLSECVPKGIDLLLKGIDQCLAQQLDKYFNMIRRGNAENCATKDIKKAVLIRTLLRSRGLACVYNCADSLTPTYSPISCAQKWEDGGPSGSSLIFNLTTTYSYGDIVQHESGFYYIFTGLTPTLGDDPELYSAETLWKRCTEPAVYSDTTDRLDPYIAFLEQFCTTCNIKLSTSTSEPVIPPTESPATDGGAIEIDGKTLNL